MKRSGISVQTKLLRAMLILLAPTSLVAAQQTAPRDEPFYNQKPSETRDKTSAGNPKPSSQRFEKQGIAIDFSIKPIDADKANDQGLVAGSDAIVSFRVTDAHTGQPITGLHPNAWISARSLDHVPNEAECKDRIKSFLGGLISSRPDLNLNAYYLLTLNHDNTITFINPQISFSATRLESIVTLPGRGSDWVLSKAKDFLYVTLPQQSRIIVINTFTRKIVTSVTISANKKPMRIALQPDGRLVWVGLDDSAGVAAIDTATNRLAAIVPVGSGLHNLAFTEDSRFLLVTNSASDTVSAIDTRALARIADISVARTPVPIAYSIASRLFYVAGINGASITVIDPLKRQTVSNIAVRQGVVALRFDPEGRYGFAVNQIDSTVSIVDAATNSIVASSEVVKGADQVVFTRGYAYIRGTETENFSLIDIGDAKKGKLAPTTIQAGQKPPSASPEDIGVADMIAPTPEGNAVMIGNAPDEVIYYYTEGLMAASGTINNYKRRAHAVMVIDHSLTEISPGLYSIPVKLRRSGRFDVPMVIDQPRIAYCFDAEVADSPEGEKQQARTPIVSEALFKDQRFRPGEPVKLRFKIVDSITKEPVLGLMDVHVLAFEPPGIWQQRQFAREVDKGVYEVVQVFPEAGLYRIMIAVESKGIRYVDLPYAKVAVLQDEKEASKKEGAKHE
jgi:YVTN family beta-propeller protein